MYAAVGGIEKPGGRQGLHIRMHITVVTPERLRQGSNAGHLVPADVAQELHPFAGQDTGERIPALERQVTLAERAPRSFGAMPRIHEPARSLVFPPQRGCCVGGPGFEPAADRDLHVAHVPPRNLEVTNNLVVEPPVRARILLTSPLESFTVGRTIVLSRGLIDVLPDEASLAMMLAHELAHIVLDHPVIDTKFAFADVLSTNRWAPALAKTDRSSRHAIYRHSNR